MAKNGYPAWVKSPKEVQEHFQVDIATGLSADEVDRRRAEYGHNELTKEPPTPIWKLIMEQFDDTLVKVEVAVHAASGPCAQHLQPNSANRCVHA